MEAERNEKARFMAQYAYQNVRPSLYGADLSLDWIEHQRTGEVNFALELNHLSAITDEDAIEIAKIVGCKLPSFERYLNYLLIRDDDDQPYPLGRSGFTFKLWFSDASIEVVINGRLGQITNQLQVYQYLQSKSYALPYMGILVQQQEEIGWIKLINK